MQLCQRILDIKQNSLASPLNVDVVKSKLQKAQKDHDQLLTSKDNDQT